MLPNIYNVESDTLGTGLSHGSSRSPSFNKTSVYTNPTMLSEFYQNLNSMRCQRELCDVTLEAYPIQGSSSEDGIVTEELSAPQHIHAHRIILSASSSYFRAMFTGGLRESSQRIVPIKEVDVEVLSQLIDYMYTGRMRIDEQNVQTILATASLLQLTCVRDACARFMLELLDMTNCVGMAEFARAHACHQLAHAAQLYTRQHFVEIIDNEELLNLDKEAFCDLIQDDRITVPSEKPVMQAVLNWVNHDETNRKVYLGELMSNVRLPLLGDDYLLEKCRSDETIKRDVACLNIIIEGIHQLKVTKERQADLGFLSSEDRNPREEVNRKWFIAREPMPESQHIMIVGGQAPKAITNVDLFDPDSQLWSSCASLPQRRCRSGVSMCNGLVYTTGGFNGAQRVKSVDYYDPRTDTWRSANQMNARRSTHGITTCQKLLYAVGGFDGTTGLASSEYFDPHTGNWFPLPSMSTRRSSVGVAAIGEDIYAIGGFDGVSKQCLNTVEIFDRRAHKWRPGPSMLNVRSGAGVTVYDKKIIAVGGHKGAEIHKSAEILIGDEWMEIANMSIPRRNTAAAALNGLLYAVGGDDGSSNLSTIECIQLSERSEAQWKIVDMEDKDAGEGSSSQLNDSFGNKEGLELLEYERATLAKTLPASVLFVVASGLGLERLFLEHLILFSDRRLLALVLNTNEHDESYFVSKLKEHGVDCDPKVINSEVSIKDRQSIYLEGGVQFCSSRVLLVDLLQNRIPTDRIAAILVYRAHQTLNAFQDSFILRLYREKKSDGMVKAFTDVPNVLSSLGQLQRLVDRLYVRHVELLPRFSSIIETELNKNQLKTAIFSVDVPTPLRRVHRTLIEFIKVCVRDLRTSSIFGKQSEDPVEEMVHVPWATTQLEKRLRDRRGNISDKQQRLLNDVASLREILQLSENMDVATVLSRLQVLKNDKVVLEEHSGWLLSPSFNRIMEDLLTIAGVTNGKGDPKKFAVPAKWTVLAEVLREIRNISLKKKEYKNSTPAVLLITSSEDLSRQVTDVVRYGMNKMKWMTWRQLGYQSKQEMPEDEPLWDPETVSQLMRSSLDMETKSEVIANVQKSQKTTARAAQKRRKHAEELSGFSKDSRVQTSLIQFGILQYKRRKSGNEGSSTSETRTSAGEWEVKDEAEEVEEYPKSLGELHAEMVVCTAREGERYVLLKLLEQKKPSAIVLYTMSLQTLRQIEIYRSTNPDRQLHVYWLQYTESTEESRYLESINRETLSFEMLIREQGTLMISREFNVDREDAPRLKTSTRDGGGIQRRDVDPRDQIDPDAPEERPKIIVDMREFNSELPTVLYTKGYDVVATTIEIGDYILSPDIAIERKALDDLTQSLQSGRVFKQIEQMLEHYDCTILLIESNRKFETKIVNGGPFQGELSRHCREIRSLFCSLIRTNPKMRCVWTTSPTNSAEFFSELKLSAPEPDVDRAVSLKSDQVEASSQESEGGEVAPGIKTKKGKKWKPNPTVVRTLSQNFGMKVSDAHNLLANAPIRTLADLFSSEITSSILSEYIPTASADYIKEVSTFNFGRK